jgi:CRP/FNR family cyclic AMP-dependent transcriptional regulator
MWWVEAIGYAGTSLTIAAWAMKTSMRLRIAGILSSVAFLLYGYLTQSYPVMIMELILMPLNVMRLLEMMRLVASVSSALEAEDSMPDLGWLTPHMRKVRLAPLETLFRRGDPADRLFIVLSGEVILTGCGTIVRQGQTIGEAGLFDPGQIQTQTCRGLKDAEIGEINQSLISELYFQNPAFGYRLTQFAVTRMRARLDALTVGGGRAGAIPSASAVAG